MKNSSRQVAKNKQNNWFKAQEEKKSFGKSPVKPAATEAQKGTAADYKELEEAPIVKVQMNSSKEEEHFEAAFAFAMKMSDPNSSEMMTIHLNMRDDLIFNMKQNHVYKALWEKKELMLLVEFPRNWKTLKPAVELDDEEDAFDDLEDDADKFDYLYETGMAIYEGK